MLRINNNHEEMFKLAIDYEEEYCISKTSRGINN